MKKFAKYLLIICLLNYSTYQSFGIDNLILNNTEILIEAENAPLITAEGYILLPIAEIGSLLNISVTKNLSGLTANGQNINTKEPITINVDIYTGNVTNTDDSILLEKACVIYNSRVYAPLNLFTEIFGYETEYIDETIYIQSTPLNLDKLKTTTDLATELTETDLETTLSNQDSATELSATDLETTLSNQDSTAELTATNLETALSNQNSATELTAIDLETTLSNPDSTAKLAATNLETALSNQDSATELSANNLETTSNNHNSATELTTTNLETALSNQDSATELSATNLETTSNNHNSATELTAPDLETTLSNQDSTVELTAPDLETTLNNQDLDTELTATDLKTTLSKQGPVTELKLANLKATLSADFIQKYSTTELKTANLETTLSNQDSAPELTAPDLEITLSNQDSVAELTEDELKTTLSIPNQSITSIIAETFLLVNQYRIAFGIEPLLLNPELTSLAQLRSDDMYNFNYYSYDSPTYGMPLEMLDTYDISYNIAGINIAKGQTSSTEVMTAWMSSSGHSQNILSSSYTEIGIGYNPIGKCWTQIFLKPQIQ
ncbi:MAG: hypothetical protein ATN31_01105 [Candidatus Epulonipiscioides saccharophilum]|nr:MAG: hypothetical protein ATN31_01105 [Epulopiscium sp. AS2M-Bin001]